MGGGLKSFEQSQKPQEEFIPRNAAWLRESVSGFDPENNSVTLSSGDKVCVHRYFRKNFKMLKNTKTLVTFQIKYEYLVVATGLQLDYDKVIAGFYVY